VGGNCRLGTLLVYLRKILPLYTAVHTLLDTCWTLLLMEILALFLDNFGHLLLDALVIIVVGHICHNYVGRIG
jgi:hypothetical protein